MNKLNIFMLIASLGLVSLVSAAAIELDSPGLGKRKNCDMSELDEAVDEMEMCYFMNLIRIVKSSECKEDELVNCIKFVKSLKEFDFAGNSALHYACINGNIAAVKLLVEKGADINMKVRRSGNTALHLACLHKHQEIISFLISSGVDHTLLNNLEQTPLEIRDISELGKADLKDRVAICEFVKAEIDKLVSKS